MLSCTRGPSMQRTLHRMFVHLERRPSFAGGAVPTQESVSPSVARLQRTCSAAVRLAFEAASAPGGGLALKRVMQDLGSNSGGCGSVEQGRTSTPARGRAPRPAIGSGSQSRSGRSGSCAGQGDPRGSGRLEDQALNLAPESPWHSAEDASRRARDRERRKSRRVSRHERPSRRHVGRLSRHALAPLLRVGLKHEVGPG